MNSSKYKSLVIFLIVLTAFKAKAQTTYMGIGGALTFSQISFTGSDGTKLKYKAGFNTSQNLCLGLSTKGGFTSELTFANTVYSGINTSLNHELSMNQIQTSLQLGYVSRGKVRWGAMTGFYFGKITNVSSTVDGKSIWDTSEPAFDKSDFGSATKLFINLRKDDSRFLFSPNLVFLYGLKNIENQDQSFKQVTKLNCVMLGINIKYQMTK